MNAPQLLETLTARGARVSLDGAALVIKPRDVLTDELRAEIRANKPALLVLLQHGDRFAESSAPASPEAAPETPAPETQPATPFRRVEQFLLVPANFTPAPGAVAICEVLQSFERLFAAARRGDLPTVALDVEIAGETYNIENAAAAVWALEIEWTRAARRCQSGQRDLTAPESAALDAAAELLNAVWACFDGPAAKSLIQV